jgi:hypothetical protein
MGMLVYYENLISLFLRTYIYYNKKSVHALETADGQIFPCARHEGVRGSRCMAPLMLIVSREENSPGTQ